LTGFGGAWVDVVESVDEVADEEVVIDVAEEDVVEVAVLVSVAGREEARIQK
jgi:hypothetical protein